MDGPEAHARREALTAEDCAKLLRAVPYTVYIFRPADGVTEYSNRNIVADLGYSPEEGAAFGDRQAAELLHPLDRARLPEMLSRWNHAADGEVLESQFRMRRADGSYRWFLSRDTILDRHTDGPDAGKVCRLVGTFLDITDRVELEQSLSRARTLEAVGRLAGGVAHDFNNLLTAIMANVALARRALATARPAEDYLAQIGQVADEASSLTRQLLTFARQQPVRSERLDANAALVELRPMLRRLIEESVEMIWELSPRAPPVSIDRTSFTQIVVNLAINARDAVMATASGGGRLSIQTGERGGGLYLTVEDTGEGMPQEVASRIFDPFFSTRRSASYSGQGAKDEIAVMRPVSPSERIVSGTGLGLSTVYGIVRRWGATIDVHTRPGQGTRFDIVFPALAADEARPPAALGGPSPARSGVATARSATILLVEDSPALAAATGGFLEDVGFAVRSARDGAEGLEIFRRHRAEIDLVISDVIMPRLSGVELARAILAEKPSLKLVLWSGYPSQDVVEDPTLAGLPPSAFRFTHKPLLPDDLLAVIDDLLGQPPPDRVRDRTPDRT